MEPQLSNVSFKNTKDAGQDQPEPLKNTEVTSSKTNYPQTSAQTLATPYNTQGEIHEHGSSSTTTSPAEQSTYFSCEKIPLTDGGEKQRVEEPPGPIIIQPEPLPPNYYNARVLDRPVPVSKRFWKKHLYWILGILVLLIVLFSIIGVIVSRLKSPKEQTYEVKRNFTRSSVACTGLTLNDNKTWNMQVFSQNSSGQIELQVSLDGKTFEPAKNLSLTIPPRKESPISATAQQDSHTGVIMLNVFYISGINNVTMSAITCAEGSADCFTIGNKLIPTAIPVSRDTGLASVSINNSQDWRVYYHDHYGFISQVKGNSSSFNLGSRIGGEGLNGSDITAVNINSSTNNIHVFYTDMLTKSLFNLQLQGNWTTPRPVSNARVTNWNPYSGLGSAYRPSLDQLHVYYTGLDKGVYEFVLNGTSGSSGTTGSNSSFQPQPDGSRPWAEADYEGADITAIGWEDQVRFFQPARGRLVMGELNDTTWGEIFVDMITSGSKILA
ncbi:hypothetical protein GcC1_108002 [Golovinomyces cichoracearum]|uniref:Fucose-specific lectin n=1 Tax=Golovinomyces cichoracearum TaxID=62708 RepID=A0A420I918_9PEZI|nr:hypothetical protein GcC1_108002 [Golovinomyces cichoracearum]